MKNTEDHFTKDEIILHIPHSSVIIPDEYRALFFLNDDELEKEQIRMTDSFTDELFDVPGIPTENRIVFPYSRLICDVERFRDDRQEIMAGRGMGICYTVTSDLKPLKTVTEEHCTEMLKLYDEHHMNLTERADELLDKYGHGIIIDCHSFASEKLPYEIESEKTGRPRPEICIGRDMEFHTPDWLGNYLCHAFRDKGYRVDIDHPFSGTLVPMKHYHRDLRLLSVMIEVNRVLYMNEETGEKNERFERIRQDIREVIEGITQIPPEKRRDKTVHIGKQIFVGYRSETELQDILDYLERNGYKNPDGITKSFACIWPKTIAVKQNYFVFMSITGMAAAASHGYRSCTLYEFQTRYEKILLLENMKNNEEGD